ncbi:MAG: hypothetical protein WCS60_10855, partial [Hydrogenophaga sp.]
MASSTSSHLSILPSFALRLTAGAALSACASMAIAQASTAGGNTLSEVVVTASGFEQEIQQAPASISVIT